MITAKKISPLLLFHKKYGRGTPLIILHGLFGSSDNWHTISKRLGKDFSVYAIDLRNHGKSPHSNVFNYRVMAEDLKYFIETHHLDKPDLIGHSMGGKLAIRFCALFPSLIRKLIVVDIAPKRYSPHHDAILDALCSIDLHSFSARKEIDKKLASMIPALEVRQFLLKNLKRTASGSFAWKLNLPVIRRNYDKLNEAIPLDQPILNQTLFIRGNHSDYIKDSDIPKLQKNFLNLQVEAIEAGHWVHAEAPDKFYRAITQFLAV